MVLKKYKRNKGEIKMFPFNWNGDDYNEKLKRSFRKRIKRKSKMYGLDKNNKNTKRLKEK